MRNPIIAPAMQHDWGPSTPSPDWYETAFGDLYGVLYAHRTVEAAAPEAAFAARVLGLRRGESLLDLCCGGGRHLVHLARMCSRATGLDYSHALLHKGRRLLGDTARLVRADMRAIPFRAAFDAVTNFFTSFGYFQTDAENMQVIAETAAALSPGGRFFIDYVNPAHVRDTLVPQSHRRVAGYEVTERRWIDDEKKRVNKSTDVASDGGFVDTFGESVRLYEEAELRALLETAGLACARVYGDYTGAPFARRCPRMILTGSKCP